MSYLNRYQGHSINVCAVSGPDLQFYYMNANFGGRSHDSRVLRCSSLWQSFEERRQRPFGNAVLLGDSGYPLRDWILTPYADPDPDQARYNRAQIRTRNTVERGFGVWKKRFYCLALILRVRDMALATKIITCCAILHNLAIQSGDSGEDLPDLPEDAYSPANGNLPDEADPEADLRRNHAGEKRRNEIVTHFRRRANRANRRFQPF